MKIPKRVKVGDITYEVRFKKTVSTGTDSIGSCDLDHSVIEIQKNLGRQMRELVFLHELVHAIFEHTNIPQDEHYVELISHALHMVIKDNPGIFENEQGNPNENRARRN